MYMYHLALVYHPEWFYPDKHLGLWGIADRLVFEAYAIFIHHFPASPSA